MDFSKRIKFYFITLLICSTIITIAGILGFKNLEPSINVLNSSNTRSIYYAEQMLYAISTKKDINLFEENLKKAQNNLTEHGEKEITDTIAANYIRAFKGNESREEATIKAISDLAHINRISMEQAGKKAKQIENIGIWIIVFPSVFIWIIGIAFLKILEKTFIKPVNELNNVVSDYNKGNYMRRCPSISVSKDLQKLYDGINRILDNR